MLLFSLLALFVAIAVGLVWFLLKHDKGTKEPAYALWFALWLGATGAVVAGLLEGWLINETYLLPGTMLNQMSLTALGIAFIEEICKFGPVAFWIYKKPYFNEHTDGVIYFAIAGLGFGLPENLLYTFYFGTDIGILRLILIPFFHAALTASVGYFLIKYKLSKKSPIGIVIPLLAVILLHGIYNFGLASGVATYIMISLMITFGITAGLFLLFAQATYLDQKRG